MPWRLSAKADIGGRQPGLPIVAMKDIGTPRERTRPPGKDRRDFRQEAEAQGIVRPVLAAFVLVRTTAATVELPIFDDDEGDAVRQRGLDEMRWAALGNRRERAEVTSTLRRLADRRVA